ncbi:MAG: phosphonate ABC transporter, permease protein PhnE, partial [Corynebacterium casei]|nr:phosphonate ABC transporter, permease protein PhnE [Corynebacterium casei]
MIKRALDLRKLIPPVLLIVALLTLGIDWRALPEVPGQVWHYLQLMFSEPDWSRLPRALAEMWRSIAMA